MVLGIFVVPRQIAYDPRPGLKPQLLLDLDPNSNEMTNFAEGITSDKDGNLYIGENTGNIIRIDPLTGKTDVVGRVEADGEGIGLFGIKFDRVAEQLNALVQIHFHANLFTHLTNGTGKSSSSAIRYTGIQTTITCFY